MTHAFLKRGIQHRGILGIIKSTCVLGKHVRYHCNSCKHDTNECNMDVCIRIVEQCDRDESMIGNVYGGCYTFDSLKCTLYFFTRCDHSGVSKM
jgi:hypothetical protein